MRIRRGGPCRRLDEQYTPIMHGSWVALNTYRMEQISLWEDVPHAREGIRERMLTVYDR